MLTFTIATNTVGVAGDDNGQFGFEGFPGEGSALLLQAVTAADQLYMAELMQGPPSGGVQTLALTTSSDYNAGVTIMVGGVTLFSCYAAASGVGSAQISRGGYPGLKKKFGSTAAYSNVSLIISSTMPIAIPFSTGHAALDATMFVSGDTIKIGDISANNLSYVILEWTGEQYIVQSNGAGVLIT
jgi:hypothetical protein